MSIAQLRKNLKELRTNLTESMSSDDENDDSAKDRDAANAQREEDYLLRQLEATRKAKELTKNEFDEDDIGDAIDELPVLVNTYDIRKMFKDADVMLPATVRRSLDRMERLVSNVEAVLNKYNSELDALRGELSSLESELRANVV